MNVKMEILEKLRPIIMFLIIAAVLTSSISSISRKRYGEVLAAIMSGAVLIYLTYEPYKLFEIGKILVEWFFELLETAENGAGKGGGVKL
jgi:hypothetical protein